MGLAQYEELENLGVTREQIKALEVLVGSTAATQSDLAKTEGRLNERIGEVKVEMLKQKGTILRWMFGMFVAQTGLLLGVLALFTR